MCVCVSRFAGFLGGFRDFGFSDLGVGDKDLWGRVLELGLGFNEFGFRV